MRGRVFGGSYVPPLMFRPDALIHTQGGWLVLRLHSLSILVALGLLTACTSGAPAAEDVPSQPSSHVLQRAPLRMPPTLQLFPSSLDFGAQEVGTTSAPQMATVRNTGSDPLYLGDGSITGPFLVSPSGPLTVPPGATQELSVTFKPTTEGSSSGTLVYSSNDPFNSRVTLFLAGQGVPPIEVSPTSLDFGEQRVGTTSASRSVTIRNASSASFTVTGISTTAPFAVSAASTPFTLAPGASRVVSATFNPTTAGSVSGTLTLSTDAPSSPSVSIPLAGRGVKPTLSVSPSSLDFGEQRVGTTSASRSVTVRNTGTSALALSALTLSSGAFSLSPTTIPLTLEPGTSREFALTFSPTSVGAFTGTLGLTSDDPDAPSASVPLAGVGVEAKPELEVSSSRLDFGASNVGSSDVLRELRFRNPGDTAVTLASATIDGTAALDFTLGASVSFPLTISAGATVTLSPSFSPRAVGSREARATFGLEGAAQDSVEVVLVGEGTSPLVAVTPGRLDFGTWRVGDTVAPLSLRLQNTGTGPLTVPTVALGGADGARFTLSLPSLPLTLAPGAFLDVPVTLTPDAVRTFSATLGVESDDASQPRVEVPLVGKAVASALSLESTSWDFGSVAVGTRSEPRTLTVTNVSSTPRTVARVQSTSAAFEVEGLQGNTLEPGASATFRVLFHPEAAGVVSGEVRLTLQGESTADAVLAVNGTGTTTSSVPVSGCSCNSGGGTGMAASLALLALLALSGRRTRGAARSTR
ncbi:MAG TPA: choice-of-anchor D domain-containing protein [Archangium sp.]|uniref:choice-of-anchor D domain-containing protein n=1 Tax=Archangium sp. TaxID=1872627 RepID=UPI002E35955A|nr:choice-of-anchor D domain-containing protein [Archangium sp.]HEX5749024.1 choice-of-anchor D domain-containing protein [Archangium sp.]